MKVKQLILLYFVFATVYFLSGVFGFMLLFNVSKLCLLPVLAFISLYAEKKINLPVILILTFYFFADIALLLPQEISLKYVLLFFGLGHLVFIKVCFDLLKNLQVKRLIYSALPIIILWFVYYNYSLKDIFGDQLGGLYLPVLVYSITLSVFTIMSLVSYFNRDSKETLYPVLVSLSFLIANVLLGINEYVTKLKIFEITTILVQIVGYYFIMRFISEYDFKRK